MKKIIAIVFVSIHLFNLVGHVFFFKYLLHVSDDRIISKIDKGEYSEDDLILVKARVPLPYVNNNNQFERVDGEIVVEGMHYRYVEMMSLNDTVYYKCLPNPQKTELSQTRLKFEQTSGAFPSSERNSLGDILKKGLFGSEIQINAELAYISFYKFQSHLAVIANTNLPESIFLPSVFSPPDLV